MSSEYYVQTPGCEQDCGHCSRSERVHLGHSAGGWAFKFTAREEWTPETALWEWLKLAASGPLTRLSGGEIPITLAELLESASPDPRDRPRDDAAFTDAGGRAWSVR